MDNQKRAALISIIIPVYDSEGTVARAIESCLGQTYGNLEIVVVDDGSSDGSRALIEGLQSRNVRIKSVVHDRNRGRLEARRTGIEAATGDFIMFLDSDDLLEPDACERLLSAQDGKFDIVQCSFKVNYSHYASREERKFDTEFCRAPAVTAFGDEVVHVTFLKRLGTWSLCGKLMKAELVKQAAAYVPAGVLNQAEDACLYFLIACSAESYRGLPGYEGYIYNIDEGGSDAKWQRFDLDRFAYSCGYAAAMEVIRSYLSDKGLMGRFGADYEVLFREHLQSAVDKLVQKVDDADKPVALSMLCGQWPAAGIAGALARACWDNAGDCWEALAPASVLQCPPHTVRTIGIYHYSMQIGGAERVAADLAGLWSSMGYRIVMLCDEPRGECAYQLPEDAEWVQLPQSLGMAPADYAQRAEVLKQAVCDYQIDAVVNHQWWSGTLAWDMMLLRLLGVATAVFCHSPFRMLFSEGSPSDVDQVRVLRYADGLIVLSELDRQFWSAQNPRVTLATHRLTLNPASDARAGLSGKGLVWVGRLSPHDKHPEEAIRIMGYLAAADVDCTLTMVGAPDSERYLRRLKKLARDLGVADRVVFTGPVDDAAPLISQAAVHLLTSSFEGYCLVLAESKALGVPCVMYELPNLPLAQGGRGIISVPQGDADAAARAIAHLLESPNELRALGDAAFEHSLELAQTDFEALWSGVFDGLAQGTPDRSDQATADALWDELVDGCRHAFLKLDDPSTRHMAKQAALKALNTAKAARWELLLRKYGA